MTESSREREAEASFVDDPVVEPAPGCRIPSDEVTCPICAGRGLPKNQKWFCERCGQLLMTCCD